MHKMKVSVLQWGHDKIVMEVSLNIIANLAALMLQWGNDKIVMEVLAIIKDCVPKYSLQWGHDKIVMEVGCHVSNSCKVQCFNGAMTK